MSEIRVTTLKDTGGSNSSTAEEIFNGRAKVWVNFNGQGTVAIRADYNVNSVSDLGTGRYAVNFSSALSDTNYCWQANTVGYNDSEGMMAAAHKDTTGGGLAYPTTSFLSTTKFSVRTCFGALRNAIWDTGGVCVTIWR